MAPRGRQGTSEETNRCSRTPSYLRYAILLLVSVVSVTQIPAVSAHGATATGFLTLAHGTLLMFLGVVVLAAAVVMKRLDRITPTMAIYGVFVGIVVTAIGAVLFEGLSPDRLYTASSMPFPRAWYLPISLGIGLLIVTVSLIVGVIRWPNRPRYTFLGILTGAWVLYPYLLPGTASDSNPLGYALVLGTPIFVGYIIWKDAGNVIRDVMRDPVARRFGVGVGIVLALFFVAVTGYLSFFPEEGFPHQVTVVVLPVIYQLVMWPTLEIAIPHIPFFLALSPGLVVIVGMLSALIGLNAALIARHWRIEESAGMTQGTAGSAAVVGSCTCGCCGPLVAKIAVLATGPSIAAPLYWLFVDPSSPLSTLFTVASILLFTGSLLYSVNSVRPPSKPSAAPTTS